MTRAFSVYLLAGVGLALLAGAAWGAVEGELDGLLEPREVVEISSQVPGILDTVLVERGDRVEANQALARLKSGLEQIAVAQAQARVEFARRRAERNQDLYLKQLISIHDKDEMETEVRIAELGVKAAAEKLAIRTVCSPVRGVVVSRALAPGEYVGTEGILTIACVDPLNVEVVVPVDRLGTIRKGMRAEVRPEPPVGGVYTAVVSIVDPVVDAASGTFGVRLELPNRSYQVPAGLKCKVRFPGN
jgi:membrane fusion protein, multidrug efflux system